MVKPGVRAIATRTIALLSGAILPLLLPTPVIKAQITRGPVPACTANVASVTFPNFPPYTSAIQDPVTGTWTVTVDLVFTYSCVPANASETKCGLCIYGDTQSSVIPTGPWGGGIAANFSTGNKPCNFNGTHTITSTDSGLLSGVFYRLRHGYAAKLANGECPDQSQLILISDEVIRLN